MAPRRRGGGAITRQLLSYGPRRRVVRTPRATTRQLRDSGPLNASVQGHNPTIAAIWTSDVRRLHQRRTPAPAPTYAGSTSDVRRCHDRRASPTFLPAAVVDSPDGTMAVSSANASSR